MKILSVTSLAISDVKVIRFARFVDERGYFTEPFRRSDFDGHPELAFIAGHPILQANESRSVTNVVRGLHFQWKPPQGKLVRTVHGHMVDMALDIRHGSPTFGKIVLHDMPESEDADWSEWIWVPPGFAHGTFFQQASRIEYYCTNEYAPGCEGGISPMAPDLDWSVCDPALEASFRALLSRRVIQSPKDRDGMTLKEWLARPESCFFQYDLGAQPL